MISFWRVFVANKGGQPGNNNAEVWTEEIVLEIGRDIIEWMKDKPAHIYFNVYMDFHCKHDLSFNFIEQQSKRFDSFRELIKKAKRMQEAKIVQYAGTKIVNPTMGIFFLKNHHGYTDKMENTEKQQVELLADGGPIQELPQDKLLALEKTLETQLGIMKGYTVIRKKPDEKKAPIKNALSNRKPNKKRSKKSTATTRKKKAS